MNTNYIKVRLEIPLNYENPDVNGAIYTRESYEKAMQYGYEGIPLITYDKDGERVPIGAGDISLIDDQLVFEGHIWSGGFGCMVESMEKQDNIVIIKDMKFESVGFDSRVNEPPIRINKEIENGN